MSLNGLESLKTAEVENVSLLRFSECQSQIVIGVVRLSTVSFSRSVILAMKTDGQAKAEISRPVSEPIVTPQAN